MADKRWVDCGIDLCPECGSELKMFTNLTDEELANNIYQDSDTVHCTDDDCDSVLQISCDKDGTWISSNN